MKAGKFLKYLVLTVVAINVAIIAAMLLGSASQPKPVPMPNPNGYDDFVRAGKAVNGNVRYTNQSRDDLAKIVAGNSEALKLLHAGVTKDCLVPDDYSTNYVNRLVQELPSFKSLIFLVCAEGKLAEMDGRTNEAMKIYLDGVRFADRSGRGGVMLSRLVSVACEAIVMPPLQSLEPNLDAKQCVETVQALEEVDAKTDPVETVLAQEKAFSRNTGGIRYEVFELLMYKSNRATRQKFVEKLMADTLRRRQAMISFAARAYELDKGKPPASIADLAPAYLKAIPQDPVTKSNLTYVP